MFISASSCTLRNKICLLYSILNKNLDFVIWRLLRTGPHAGKSIRSTIGQLFMLARPLIGQLCTNNNLPIYTWCCLWFPFCVLRCTRFLILFVSPFLNSFSLGRIKSGWIWGLFYAKWCKGWTDIAFLGDEFVLKGKQFLVISNLDIDLNRKEKAISIQ